MLNYDFIANCIAVSQFASFLIIISFAGGKQFKITSNDIIMIHKVAAKCGDKIRLRKVCSDYFLPLYFQYVIMTIYTILLWKSIVPYSEGISRKSQYG